jgi:hypothetical protein
MDGREAKRRTSQLECPFGDLSEAGGETKKCSQCEIDINSSLLAQLKNRHRILRAAKAAKA